MSDLDARVDKILAHVKKFLDRDELLLRKLIKKELEMWRLTDGMKKVEEE